MKNKPKFKAFFAIMLVISILMQQFSLTAVLADGTEQEIILNDSEGESIDEGNIEQPAPLSVPDSADTLPPAVAPGDIEGPEDDQDMPVLPEDEDKNAISNPTDTEGDLNDTTDPTDTEGDQNDTTDPTDTEGDQNDTIKPEEPGQGEEDTDEGKVIEPQEPRILKLTDIAVPGSIKARFEVNGVEIDSNTHLDYNSAGLAFRVFVSWNVMDGDVLTPVDTVVYELPKNLKIEDVTGDLKGLGTYTISDNTLSVQFNEKYMHLSGRYAFVSFEGVVDAKQQNDGEGGEIRFEFPGIGSDFIINVDRDDTNDVVEVDKKDATRFVENGRTYYSFLVKVTSKYNSKDIYVVDKLDKNLTLLPGSIGFYTDDKCQQVYGGAYNKLPAGEGVKIAGETPRIEVVPADESGFGYVISEMQKNEVLYIKYNVLVKEEAYAKPLDKGNLSNTVTVSTDKSADTDTGKVAINKTWIEKAGQYKDGQINWTIKVNQGDKLEDIGGTVIKDILGDNQIYVEDSIHVTESSDGTTFLLSSLDPNITWEALSSEEGYVFPTGANKIYKIEYKTTIDKINEGSVTTVENGFSITPWDKYEKITKWSNVIIGEQPQYDITKKCLTEDGTLEDDGTVAWEVTLKIPEGGIKNLQVDDKLPKGMELVKGSFKIISGVELIPKGFPQGPTWSKPDGGGVYTIRFGDASKAGSITFQLKTIFVNGVIPDNANTYENTVWEKSGKGTNLDWGSAKYNWKRYLKKSIYTKNIPQGQLGWELKVDKLPETAAEVVITDNLPENTSFIKDSLKIIGSNGQEANEYIDHLTTAVTGQTLIFTFDDTLIELAKAGSISLRYQLSVDSQEEVKHNYINKAQITINGTDYGWSTASQTYTKSQEVTKTGDYDYDTAPYVYYKIEVNPDEMDLSAGEETIELFDVLAEGLTFIMGSLEINGKPVSGNDYSYDLNTRELKMTVPDSKHLTVTYKVQVDLSAGTSFTPENGKNTCKLSGKGVAETESSVELKGKVLSSQAGAGGKTVGLKIYKYGLTSVDSLSEAVFQVSKLNIENGSVKGETVLDKKITTGKDGYTEEISGLLRDTVYKIVEIEAPEGYQLDKTPGYIVFNGNSGINWNERVDGLDGEIYIVSEDKASYVYYKQNQPFTGALKLTKSFAGDSLTAEQKEKIIFEIKSASGKITEVTYKDFEDGSCIIPTLPIGEYTVTEKNAEVDGYSVTTTYKVNSEETKKVSVVHDDSSEINITNTYSKEFGSLTIVKEFTGDDLTEEQKANITFKITGPENYSREVKYSEFKNGRCTIDKLKPGEYTVIEENADVEGYTRTTTYKVGQDVTNTGDVIKGDELTVKVTNNYAAEKKMGSLTIVKHVEGINLTDEQKKNITFTVTGEGLDNPLSITYAQFENGSYTFDEIPVGEYTVTETNADVPGYTLTTVWKVGATETSEVTVTKGDNTEINVTNTYSRDKGQLEIKKAFSGIDASELTEDQKKNITFTVTGEGLDNPLSITYDQFKNGSYTFDEIPVGEYTVMENNAEVKGYTLTTVWKVGESETSKVFVTKGENTEIDVTNTYSRDKGQLEIEKAFSGIDASELTEEQKKEISFTITGPDYSRTVTYDMFTDTKLILEGLETGEYTVIETHAADIKDHKLSISYSVTDGKVTVEKDRIASVKVTNTYSKETGKLIIAKKFAGASLTESQKKDIIFKVTGPNGYNDTISYEQFKEGVYIYPNLPVGEYVVTESNAEVPGYSVTTTYNTVGGKVTVNANDESTVTVTNTYSRYSISTSASILKVDGDKKPLAGAELAIKNGNGDVIEKWISTDKAHIIWGKLSIGGKYVLTELKAPQGYTLAKDIEFTMPSNGIIELTMVDEKEVTLGKISATKKVSVINEDAIEDYKVTEDTVYYMALFKDAAGEERYTEYDVKPVVVKKDTSLSEAVVWDDIPFGTYYVFETDAAGKAIPLNVKQDVTDDAENPYSYTCVVAEGTTNKVELGTQAGNIAGQVALENVYQTELPSHYFKEGVIKVNKKVLKDGSTFNTNTKFYAGIFTKNEDGSYEQFTVITLKNNGTVLVNVPLGGEYQDGSEPITYYVRETDKYGDPLDADVFAYEISGEGEVTLAGENTQATVTITNTAKENTSEVDILKVDENGKALAGAAFTLTYNEAGVTAGKWTSTTTARTLTLIPGSYTLTEVQAPTGYIKGSDATITVADDGTVKVSGNNVSYKDGVVRYVNKKSSSNAEKSNTPGISTKYYAASNRGVNNTVYKASVKTGDETTILLYLFLLMGASLVAGFVICIRSRKKIK